MFRKKNDCRILELSPAEKRMLIHAMLHFRNRFLATGKRRNDRKAASPFRNVYWSKQK